MVSSEGINKKLPIKSDEEFSLVDKRFEPSARRSQISNFEFIRDLAEVADYLTAYHIPMRQTCRIAFGALKKIGIIYTIRNKQ